MPVRVPRSGRGFIRGLLFACVTVLVVGVAGCSKNPSRPQPQEPTRQLGTPITAAGTVEASSPLLWSALTNELVCASWRLDIGGLELAAVHSMSGASRTLDTALAIPLTMAHDGSAVYYEDLEPFPDSVRARRIGMAPGAMPLTLGSCSGFCAVFAEPAPDGDRVAIQVLAVDGAYGVDSIVIHRLSTGERTPLITGTPIAFSPTSEQLLVRRSGSFEIVTLASGVTQPAGIALPETTGGARLRWGSQGPEALYVASDSKRLYLRRADPATASLIWTSPDTLHGYPIAWSASGQRAALWSSRQVGTAASRARRWELHAVDLVSRATHVIAFATDSFSVFVLRPSIVSRWRTATDIFPPTPPDGLAFSADESQLAYTFFDGRIYRSPWSAALPLANRR